MFEVDKRYKLSLGDEDDYLYGRVNSWEPPLIKFLVDGEELPRIINTSSPNFQQSFELFGGEPEQVGR